MKKGIQYQVTNDERRSILHSYHAKPYPLSLNKTKYKSDVDSLKANDRKYSIVKFGTEYESKFTIGFEVEKNSFHRTSLKEYELFCGFERDGSCGVEAVTHILPLLPQSQWRTKVFDMMHKAEKIIDDRFSPSDRRCGGHITIGVQGMRGSEILEKVRKFSGLVYALFPNRLQNHYCSFNKRMLPYMDCPSNNWHYKYQACLVKEMDSFGVIEFRLPSKIESVKQMMRRYEFMYEIVNHSINDGGNFAKLIKKIQPILMSMYNNDAQKVAEKIEMAIEFQNYIDNNILTHRISQYILS